VSALRKLEWAKDTPRWVTTNTTSKKRLKGRLVVVVVAGLVWGNYCSWVSIMLILNKFIVAGGLISER